VLVAGGNNDNGNLASAELYDPATATWTDTGSLNTARGSHTATLLPDGEVLAAGGFNADDFFLPSAELYEPGIGVVEGRGAADNQGNEVTFNFRATQSDESGTLGYFSFCDPAAGVCIAKARIWTLSLAASSADFTGRDDASRLRFRVSAADNGDPGTSDTISISLSDGYSVSGTLISGDIRIQ
jgi:Galactose oxidase, central domain